MNFKRFFLVSAILVLAGTSSIFAASKFKGKARMRFGYKHDYDHSETFGLMNKSDFTGEFFLDESTKSFSGRKEGEDGKARKPYGEVKAYAKFRSKFFAQPLYDEWLDISNLKMRFGFEQARIVFDEEKNTSFVMFGHSPINRYAKGWENEIDTGALIETEPFITNSTVMSKEFQGEAPVARAYGGYFPTVGMTFANYTLSLGLDGGFAGRNYAPKQDKANKDKVDYLVTLGANKVKLNDEMDFSLQGGIFNSNRVIYNGAKLNRQQHILYGGQFNYKNDKLKINAGLTGNVRINEGTGGLYQFTDVDERNAMEASVSVEYKDDIQANFDLWFLDNQALWSDSNEPDEVTYNNRGSLGFVYRDKDGHIYDGETGADGSCGDNNIHLHKALSARFKVKPSKQLGVTVTAQDILNQGIYGVKVPVALSKVFTITPLFEFTTSTNKTYVANEGWKQVDTNGDPTEANNVVEGGVEFNYKHKDFTLFTYARVGVESLTTGFYVIPYLSLESRTLVDGARLSCVWKNGVIGHIDTPIPYHTGVGIARPSEKYVGNDGNGYFGQIYLEARIDFK